VTPRPCSPARVRKGWIARLLPFLGPAFICQHRVCGSRELRHQHPGGAQFGYELLWVILGSNLMAMLLQALSAKLGIATGKNLGRALSGTFSTLVVWIMVVLMSWSPWQLTWPNSWARLWPESAFGLPLWIAGLLTAIITFVILSLERYGFRPLEAVITGFLAIIAISYLIELFLGHPDWTAIGYNTFVPHFFKFGERSVGSRHPGRYRHATRHFFAFRPHAGTAWSSKSRSSFAACSA